MAALLDQHCIAFVTRQHFDFGACFTNNRRADENRFHFFFSNVFLKIPFELNLGNLAFALAAIGVALDAYIYCRKTFLLRISDCFRQKNRRRRRYRR